MNNHVLEIDGVPLTTVERINRSRTIAIARYEEDGCFDRFGYIKDLASDHGIAIADAIEIAELLGPEEDFDGLVTTLEDFSL
jgi:glycosidase